MVWDASFFNITQGVTGGQPRPPFLSMVCKLGKSKTEELILGIGVEKLKQQWAIGAALFTAWRMSLSAGGRLLHGL